VTWTKERKMTKGPYTRITFETMFVGKHRKFIAETNQWDCTLDDMMEMFKGLLLCLGFSSKNIDDYLGECKCVTEVEDQ
jgi:hypothetical protein